jgi:hypothetical protein
LRAISLACQVTGAWRSSCYFDRHDAPDALDQPDGRLQLGQVLSALFPDASRDLALSSLRQFRSRLAQAVLRDFLSYAHKDRKLKEDLLARLTERLRASAEVSFETPESPITNRPITNESQIMNHKSEIVDW